MKEKCQEKWRKIHPLYIGKESIKKIKPTPKLETTKTAQKRGFKAPLMIQRKR